MADARSQDSSGVGCGCLLVILALVFLASGAGWYFAVKEKGDFVGAKTIRSATEEFTEVSQKMSSRTTEEDLVEVEREIHRLVNAQRQHHGLISLAWQEEVAAIARAHSEDMAIRSYFDHVNPKGENPTARAIRSGYPCRKARSYGLAENILQAEMYHSRTWHFALFIPVGRSTDWMNIEEIAEEAVSSWMFSPGHRKNILTGRYDRAGIGAAMAGDTIFLTQNFC